MEKYQQRFYKYPKGRDVVFVFGAGASYADGAPLQSEILPIILSEEALSIQKSKVGQLVIEFIKDNFLWDPQLEIYPSLENIFSFLDYFIIRDEHLSYKYQNSKIHDIKEALIKLIHYVISSKTKGQGATYRYFWEMVCKYNRNISILTLNYDTLLEEAFDFMCPNYGYIDYCIYLMNYDNPQGLDKFNWWINPREPFFVPKGENPIPIKIMKLHGSLNWKYCNCCNQILLTPWDTKIDLSNNKLIHSRYSDYKVRKKSVEGYSCPVDSNKFKTLILPPVYNKNLSNPIISQIFNEALREIRASKRVVFIGYSFPDADVHFKALFKKGLLTNKDIIVINVKISERLKFSYKALSKNIKFIEYPFEELVYNESLMKELLT